MHNYAQADVGGFFCSNCVEVVSYSILHNYAQADAIALSHRLNSTEYRFLQNALYSFFYTSGYNSIQVLQNSEGSYYS